MFDNTFELMFDNIYLLPWCWLKCIKAKKFLSFKFKIYIKLPQKGKSVQCVPVSRKNSSRLPMFDYIYKQLQQEKIRSWERRKMEAQRYPQVDTESFQSGSRANKPNIGRCAKLTRRHSPSRSPPRAAPRPQSSAPLKMIQPNHSMCSIRKERDYLHSHKMQS